MNLKSKVLPLAMIICDSVITDVATRKKTVVGIFSRIQASKVPIKHHRLEVFLILTEGHGDYLCELKCAHADSGDNIFQLNGQMRFNSPNDVVDLVFDLPGIVFPKYGPYRFEFYCEGAPVISRNFEVTKPKEEVKNEESV